MVQPPSKQLQQLLFGRKLCTPRDVRRCTRLVKRLAMDLPAFDSVWLDALVQKRYLTAFQSQSIETGQTDLLTIGPCVILDRLGHGTADETFLGRLPDESRCVIKHVAVPAEQRGQTHDALTRLVDECSKLNHPAICGPHSTRDLTPTDRPSDTARFALVSRVVQGLPLTQLLCRRGRFPERVVLEIARQLLSGLAALHARGIVHGEIRLDNVLLNERGECVLVDPGVQPAVQPVLQIHTFTDPDRYDGIAPELIGTGETATPRSDLYALGCLLWHLLAGRPVWPTGDPLARLAAHQTSRVPDIREIAPETPDRLADAIRWMTEPLPANRPRSADELLSDAADRGPGSPATVGQRGGTRRATTRFARQFRHPSPRPSRPAEGNTGRTAMFAAAALLIAVGTFLWLDGRARALVLTAISRQSDSEPQGSPGPVIPDGEHTVATLNSHTSEPAPWQEMPEPDAAGIVWLDGPGPWLARPIRWAGARVTIQTRSAESSAGSADEPTSERDSAPVATVLVFSEPFAVSATEVVIRNVRLLPAETASPPLADATNLGTSNAPPRASSRTLLLVRSQLLTVADCSFGTLSDEVANFAAVAPDNATELAPPGIGSFDAPVAGTQSRSSDPRSPQETTAAGYAIDWASLDASDPLAGAIHVADSLLLGRTSCIRIHGRSRDVQITGTLKNGAGPLLELAGAAKDSHAITLDHVTVRSASSLVDLDVSQPSAAPTQLLLKPRQCVLNLQGAALADTTSTAASQPGSEAGAASFDGLGSSLVRFIGERLPQSWFQHIEIDGQHSVVNPGVSLACLQSRDGRRQELDASGVRIQGLTQTQFHFHGPPSDRWNDAVIAHIDANRSSQESPGIQSRNR